MDCRSSFSASIPHFWALVLGGLVAGLTMEQFGIAWETTMQEHVPADKLARVYSYDMVGSFVAIPIGQMAIGPISGAIGVRSTLVGAGVLVMLAALAMVGSRAVRTLRHELPVRAPEAVSAPVEESVA
jgi:MFS family permease